jgi:hypothetical protein
MTSPVLRQAGPRWQTTVIVNYPGTSCPPLSAYALEASPPQEVKAPSANLSHAGTNRLGACKVALTFGGLPQVPSSASLAVTVAGTTTTVPLTVVRQVSLLEYLWIPVFSGLGLVTLLWLSAVTFVRVYPRDPDKHGQRRRIRPFRPEIWPFRPDFWRYTITASGAWTVNDSWATNVTTVTAVIATALGGDQRGGRAVPRRPARPVRNPEHPCRRDRGIRPAGVRRLVRALDRAQPGTDRRRDDCPAACAAAKEFSRGQADRAEARHSAGGGCRSGASSRNHDRRRRLG